MHITFHTHFKLTVFTSVNLDNMMPEESLNIFQKPCNLSVRLIFTLSPHIGISKKTLALEWRLFISNCSYFEGNIVPHKHAFTCSFIFKKKNFFLFLHGFLSHGRNISGKNDNHVLKLAQKQRYFLRSTYVSDLSTLIKVYFMKKNGLYFYGKWP